MIGKIISIKDNVVELELQIDLNKVQSLVNYHVVFENENYKVVGEIKNLTINKAFIGLIGEIKNKKFVSGVTRKPSFSSTCRIINKEELDIITGNIINAENGLYVGKMPLYDDYPINININNFFSNHFAIFGNTGSGKSFSTARLIQNIFYDSNKVPSRANIFIFDAYGEYHTAFNKINEYSPQLNFKTYTTNLKFSDTEIFKIPLWLLSVDDIALLLDADNHIQLPIIEKALRLVSIFAQAEEKVIEYKNDIIARAILEILYSGGSPSQIRDQILAVLTSFNTKDLNLETKITQPGYVRTLRQCLIIDKDGKLHEMQLITSFITSFIKEGLELKLPDGSFPYTLKHLKEAFDFALISEGILNSDKVYDYANVLKVRLHALINGDYSNYFEINKYMPKEVFINNLLTTFDGKKAQIVNFNINYVDDRFAKVITKIYSKLLYEYVARLEDRTSFPIHIILEEAHRYVQNDNDVFLLGYNIFDRITKEGRKYGILLGLISQRPSELSETSLSQCSNFLIFKMIHPKDLDFIRNMVPNISDENLQKLKTLQPGTSIVFGTAFQIPIIIKFEAPDPIPQSSNADIRKKWYIN